MVTGAATVGIGHGRPAFDDGGRCAGGWLGFCRVGDEAGVVGPWLSVGVEFVWVIDGGDGVGRGGGLASSSRRRLVPRICVGRVELSFSPRAVALSKI